MADQNEILLEKPRQIGPIEPKSLGGIIGETFRVYGNRFWPFVAIIAVIEAPLIILTGIWASLIDPSPGLILTGLLVTFMASIVMVGATVCAVSQHYGESKVSIFQAYWAIWQRRDSLFGAASMVSVSIVALLVTIIGIPVGIFFFVTWAFVMPAILFEGHSIADALSRSSSLVKGGRWQVLRTLLVLGLLGVILGAIAGGVVGIITRLGMEAVGASDPVALMAAIIAGGLVGMIFIPIGLIGTTLLYLDLRVRKEGTTLPYLDLLAIQEVAGAEAISEVPDVGGVSEVGGMGVMSSAGEVEARRAGPVGLIIHGINSLDKLTMYYAAAGLAAMFGIVFSEVLMRSLFTKSSLFADELASYLLAVVAFCAMGYTLRTDGHIAVTLFSARFSAKVRKWLDVVLSFVGLFCITLLVYWTLDFVIDSWQTGIASDSQIDTPLWAPRSMILLGSIVMGLAFVSRILRVLRNEYKP